MFSRSEVGLGGNDAGHEADNDGFDNLACIDWEERLIPSGGRYSSEDIQFTVILGRSLHPLRG